MIGKDLVYRIETTTREDMDLWYLLTEVFLEEDEARHLVKQMMLKEIDMLEIEFAEDILKGFKLDIEGFSIVLVGKAFGQEVKKTIKKYRILGYACQYCIKE